jgi:hypothetical protein
MQRLRLDRILIAKFACAAIANRYKAMPNRLCSDREVTAMKFLVITKRICSDCAWIAKRMQMDFLAIAKYCEVKSG